VSAKDCHRRAAQTPREWALTLFLLTPLASLGVGLLPIGLDAPQSRPQSAVFQK
jgi:hypothetical protein